MWFITCDYRVYESIYVGMYVCTSVHRYMYTVRNSVTSDVSQFCWFCSTKKASVGLRTSLEESPIPVACLEVNGDPQTDFPLAGNQQASVQAFFLLSDLSLSSSLHLIQGITIIVLWSAS